MATETTVTVTWICDACGVTEEMYGDGAPQNWGKLNLYPDRRSKGINGDLCIACGEKAQAWAEAFLKHREDE